MQKNGIDFFTSPYDFDYVDRAEKYICAYKIGSGDITWLDILKKYRKKITSYTRYWCGNLKRGYKLLKQYSKTIKS